MLPVGNAAERSDEVRKENFPSHLATVTGALGREPLQWLHQEATDWAASPPLPPPLAAAP